MKLWKYDEAKGTVKEVECPDGGYPASDIDGVQIYDNTHFETEKEAWESLRENAEAWVSLSGGGVKNAELGLLEAQAEAGKACKAFANYKRNFRRWESEYLELSPKQPPIPIQA